MNYDTFMIPKEARVIVDSLTTKFQKLLIAYKNVMQDKTHIKSTLRKINQEKNTLFTENTDLKFENTQLQKALRDLRSKVQERMPVVSQIERRCAELETDFTEKSK